MTFPGRGGYQIFPEDESANPQGERINTGNLLSKFGGGVGGERINMIQGSRATPDASFLSLERSNAKSLLRDLETLNSTFSQQEAVTQATRINTATYRAQEEYLRQNPNGQGLSSEILELHKKLSNDAINSNDITGETSELLRTMCEDQRNRMTIPLLEKERSVGIKSMVNSVTENTEVILSQLFDHPEDAISYQEEYLLALNPIRSAEPAIYEDLKKQYMGRFSKVQALGCIYKDPWSAKAVIDQLEYLTPEDKLSLQDSAQKRIHHLQIQDERVKTAAELVMRKTRHINYLKTIDLIESGQCSEFLIDQQNLDEVERQVLLNRLHSREREEGKKDQAISRALDNLSKDLPNSSLSPELTQRLYSELTTQRKAGLAEGVELTPLDKVEVAISLRSPHSIETLKSELTSDILRGAPQEALSASLALQYAQEVNQSVLKGISPLASCIAHKIVMEGIYENAESPRLSAIVEEAQKVYQANLSPQELVREEESYSKLIEGTPLPYSTQKLISDSQNPGEMRAFAESVRHSAYLLGKRGEELVDYVNQTTNQVHGTSFLNKSKKGWRGLLGGYDKPMFMPPEKLRPDLTKEQIRKDFMESIEYLVKNGTDSRITLGQKWRLDSEFPEIEIISPTGESMTRQVFIEKNRSDQDTYSLTYYLDESNPLTKIYLTNPGSTLPAKLRF